MNWKRLIAVGLLIAGFMPKPLTTSAASLSDFFPSFRSPQSVASEGQVRAATSCPLARMKIDFTQVEQNNQPVTNNKIILGNGTVVNEGEWFSLIEDGGAITDPTLKTNASSLAIRRSNGNVQILGHQNFPPNAVNRPKTVYGTVTIEGTEFTKVNNGIPNLSARDGLELFGNNRWGVYTQTSSSSSEQTCKYDHFLGRVICFIVKVVTTVTCFFLGWFCPPPPKVTTSNTTYIDDEARQVSKEKVDFYLHYGLHYGSDNDGFVVNYNPVFCEQPVPIPNCSDSIDNDGDGDVDCNDSGCWIDNNPSQCSPDENGEVPNSGGSQIDFDVFKEVD